MVEPINGGIIGLILLIIFLFLHMPIFAALGLSGMVGLLLIEGFSGAFIGIGSLAFEELWGLSLLAVPLFIFMGHLVTQFGIGADLYDTTYKWMGRFPGGLAIASTGMSALFGFICGSGVAGNATIGGIAIPEMEKRGYSRHLALGTLAVAGSLAALIPPSVLMILYSINTMTSMGAIFLAGIIPGLLLATMISIFIMIRCIINPKLGPKGDKFSLIEKLKSMAYLIPVIVLFLSVIGGIYKGIWSPVEAGAIACLVVVIIALFYRRLSWKKITEAAYGAAKTSIMIYMLLVGATILSTLFFVSGLNTVIEQAVTGLPLPAWGIILVLLFVMMIMGMFMDVLALLLISLPITLPIILSLGYDPVWWGIMVLVSCEMALDTPPVGVSLIVIQGVAPKGTSLTDVALGAAPFVGILWVFIGLLLSFPEIVMFLPNAMIR
jgi:C4-dicarboxylate transporter DctM subunit